MSDQYRTGITYLQIRPEGARRLKVSRATQGPPDSVSGDAIVIRLRLRVPDSAFDGPIAEVVVPESAVILPVEAVADEDVDGVRVVTSP